MNKIYFFGYGANRSKTRLNDILEKETAGGYGAVLENYVLAIQTLDQLPLEEQEAVKVVWGENFRAYTLKPGKGLVAGLIWELEEKDLNIIKQWESIGKWRELIEVKVETWDGRQIEAITEKAYDKAPIKKIVDGLDYINNLNTDGQKIMKYEDEYKIKEIAKIRDQMKSL